MCLLPLSLMTQPNINHGKQTKPIKLREIPCTSVFHRNYAAKSRTVINIGGARSSKSHSIAQLLIERAIRGRNLEIGIMRKTGPALKRSAQRLTINLMAEYGLYKQDAYHRQEGYYDLRSNRFTFMSLDDPSKARSTEFNYIWLEEANEFTFEDYLTLRTRLSKFNALGIRNQIFCSLNPDDPNGWIHQNLIGTPDAEVIHSTYRDNPFVDADYIKDLLSLKDIDPETYAVFALGEWAQASNLIYPKVEYCEKLPDTFDYAIRGLDFGFNNPTALVKIAVKDSRPYVQQELYESGLNNRELIAQMDSIIPSDERDIPIYADSEASDRIDEISKEGYNIIPAEKGPGSVHAGILSLKSARPIITQDSAELVKEIKVYKWLKNRDGKPTDKPVKFNDHAMDAMRYAWFSHNKTYIEPRVTIL